jgi:hypothetical protein
MQNFSLIVGAAPNDVIEVQKNRSKPAPGDQLLLLERPLLVPNTNQQFGNLLARITYMRILAGGDVFVLGNAEHRLRRSRALGRPVTGALRPGRTRPASFRQRS